MILGYFLVLAGQDFILYPCEECTIIGPFAEIRLQNDKATQANDIVSGITHEKGREWQRHEVCPELRTFNVTMFSL